MEDTPRNSGQNFSDLEGNDALGSKEDGNKAGEQHKRAYDGLTVAKLFRGPTVDHQADDFSDVNTIAETGLPRRRHLVSTIVQLLAKFLVEFRKCVEVGQETSLVACT